MDNVPIGGMETRTIFPKKRGRKPGSTKPEARKHVRVNFSFPPEVVRALEERVDPGERSMFIVQLIRREFGLWKL